MKESDTLERIRGEIPELANQRAMNSTMGVFPLPPHVIFPTLITGTGNLQNQGKNYQKEQMSQILVLLLRKWRQDCNFWNSRQLMRNGLY